MALTICSKCYTCIDDRFDLTEARGVLPVVCFDCMIDEEFPTKTHGTLTIDPTEVGNQNFQEVGT